MEVKEAEFFPCSQGMNYPFHFHRFQNLHSLYFCHFQFGLMGGRSREKETVDAYFTKQIDMNTHTHTHTHWSKHSFNYKWIWIIYNNICLCFAFDASCYLKFTNLTLVRHKTTSVGNQWGLNSLELWMILTRLVC